MAHRERVPLVSFNPSMGKGYRSDVNANTYPQMAPIRFGLGLPDILQNGAKGIPGAQDVVFGQVPYGVFKLHLVVSFWIASSSRLFDYLLFSPLLLS